MNSSRAHLALELEALNAGRNEPLAPVPRLELAQSLTPEHHLIFEEREGRRVAAGHRQTIQLLERRVHGLLARRMSLGIERHDAERVSEGVEESDGIAHVVCGDDGLTELVIGGARRRSEHA